MEKINYIELYKRFLKGETNATENRIIFDWFKKDKTRTQLFDYYEEEWHSASDEMPEESKKRILDRIKQQTDYNRDKQANGKSLMRPILKYAVAACLFILIGGGWITYFESTFLNKEFVVVAEDGQRATIKLPDSTIVWLNSGTKLKYTGAYNTKNRTVELDGEACFKVQKDTDKDFIVKAGDLEIKALGTMFDVKAYSDDAFVVTTLIEGEVSLKSNTKELILQPNEQVNFMKAEGLFNDIQVCNASRAVLWKNNELFFDCETLEQVSEQLKRLYSMDVIFLSESVKKHTYCGVINNNNMHNVLEYISLTSPVAYDVKENTIYFKEKK